MVDKDRIQKIAEDIAWNRHCKEFYDLPTEVRDKIYEEAIVVQSDEEADKADNLRKEENVR